MKKILFTISAALLLTSCKNMLHIGDILDGPGMVNEDTTEIVNNSDEFTGKGGSEEGEADDSEMMGLAPYGEAEMDISKLPATAQEQDTHGQLKLYVNTEVEPDEDNLEGTYSVWLANQRTGKVRRILMTNPTAAGMWDEMKEKNGGVEVEMHLIATAEKAMFASADGKKIIVEGCPDARNTWTYLIDLDTRKAMQIPGTEGVQEINIDKKEIITASYGYYPAPDYGRYTYSCAYSLDGKFLRQTSDPEPE